VIKDGHLELGLGSDPQGILRSANNDDISNAIEKIGPDASFVLAGRGDTFEDVSSLALVKKDGKIAVSVEIVPVLIREVVALFGR